jgi:hypothetical protein
VLRPLARLGRQANLGKKVGVGSSPVLTAGAFASDFGKVRPIG